MVDPFFVDSLWPCEIIQRWNAWKCQRREIIQISYFKWYLYSLSSSHLSFQDHIEARLPANVDQHIISRKNDPYIEIWWQSSKGTDYLLDSWLKKIWKQLCLWKIWLLSFGFLGVLLCLPPERFFSLKTCKWRTGVFLSTKMSSSLK